MAIIVSACESVGKPQSEADCIAAALEHLGYDTLEIFATWGHGALGRAEVEPKWSPQTCGGWATSWWRREACRR